MNKLVTDEFTSGETVLHEGSLNEGRFSAFRGYQLTEALAIALTFELEQKRDFCLSVGKPKRPKQFLSLFQT